MSDVYEDAPADASLADPLPTDPFQILSRWFDEARGTSLNNPGAVIVSTVDADGNPRARTVLCRGVERDRGALVFYTNRNSAKGRQIAARPRASAVFYWDPLARQVCASGRVEHTSEAESD